MLNLTGRLVQHLALHVDMIGHGMFTLNMTPRPPARQPRIVTLVAESEGGVNRGASMASKPGFLTLADEMFLVEGAFRVQDGGMRLVELKVRVVAQDDSVEITATSLRDLHLADLVRVAKGMIAEQAHFWTPEGQRAAVDAAGGNSHPLPEGVVKEARRRIKLASARKSRAAPRGRGNDFYRRIALDLVELVESGKPTPGGVLETLARIEAKRLRLPDVPVQTMRTWLRIARERQFLAPGERGRLIALPGPMLYLEES